MTREIKFRVWDNNDYMSKPFTLQDLMTRRTEFTSDCPVMQFTGLVDKAGKEIYESDIVLGANKKIPYVVEFIGAAFHCVSEKHFTRHWPLSKGSAKSLTIVGNVYESQALLTPSNH